MAVRTGRRAANTRRRAARQAKERWQVMQLWVCGSAFVLLVAAKLLSPGRAAPLREKLGTMLERNMDVQAVFSAVGRAFAGEGGVSGAAEQVYQAVFRPQAVPASAPAPWAGPLEEGAALEALREYRPQTEEDQPPAGPAAEETGGGEVLYSPGNLPEDASMEQAILGFDYAAPVSGTLTSGFGYRDHPLRGTERFHYGVDLAAAEGTDILCFADGTVSAVGKSSSYGNYCTVSHGGGFSTLYAHCSAVTASSGQEVRRGEKIGEVGSTGEATGPHLHFEIQRDGVYLNPVYYVS